MYLFRKTNFSFLGNNKHLLNLGNFWDHSALFALFSHLKQISLIWKKKFRV